MPGDGRRSAVFALPPGADFPAGLVEGLIARYGHLPPERFARIELFVNTRRMQRRIRDLFGSHGARLLPRIRLVTDLGRDLADPGLPPSTSPLRRRLELAQLVGRLLDTAPDLAPRSAIYDLADSLAALLDEMQGEGVGPDAVAAIDDSDASDHWKRRRAFIGIVLEYLEAAGDRAPDPEERQRRAVDRLATRWADAPPDHPVIVAGSTGSRGTTLRFMEAVAGLATGAIVLPGFDFGLPDRVWAALDDRSGGEDHPQFRFRRLMDRLGLAPGDIVPWSAHEAPSADRNRLVSLALRPAPVTHEWMTEGPRLGNLAAATHDMCLVEAPNPRKEALAIAVRLRKAVEDGQRAALVTPDRVLTRRVAAALDRWGIVPDDSAGQPLGLSPPGRFLRHVAALFGTRLTVEHLLVLLKHPLTHTGGEDRGPHLLWTRDLELHLRRHGPPFPDRAHLLDWAGSYEDPQRIAWASWVAGTFCGLDAAGDRPLSEHVRAHLDLANRIAAGTGAAGSGTLWDQAAGRKAAEVMAELERESVHGGMFSTTDYAALVRGVIDRGEVRNPDEPHPDVMIWGTLEARVQGADLVILAGLNEGVWPEAPAPDPWLNRDMRRQAGLLLPERRIGLSAHDFQQAVAAPEVMLTRSLRDAEAETVPSRWLNRLTNLLNGLPGDGVAALEGLRDRGSQWLALADALEPHPAEAAPVPRPSPRPPVGQRPRQLSVTRIQTLIRDPYAIYANRILRLEPLNPLRQEPDAPLRGTVLHDIFEEFIDPAAPWTPEGARERLLAIADRKLADGAPWPVARRLWRARLERVADDFLATEDLRRAEGIPLATEGKGELPLPEIDFTLTAKADRIDRLRDGSLAIYDYKTGSVPTEDQIRRFDKQLLLEAIMAEAGAFRDVGASPVSRVAYLGIGTQFRIRELDLGDPDFDLAPVRARFLDLIRAYDRPEQGYTSRRAVEREGFAGDYDHLARLGEWDDGQDPVAEDVG